MPAVQLAVPSRPSPEVLRAFGLTGTPIALDSGQGTSWRVADAVLKPLDMSPDEVAWLAHTYEQIVCDGFRVAVPLQANNGQLVVDGWRATKAVSGRHESGRWKDIIVVGERFHGALIGVGRPEFIDRRTNPWAVADRVAWNDEEPADAFMDSKHLPRLLSLLRPVDEPSPLVHGDLTGNVLFDSRLPPAIIDFSPYWRPAGTRRPSSSETHSRGREQTTRCSTRSGQHATQPALTSSPPRCSRS
jgi:uncharacterized protein (TIGR02569 family)